MGYKASVYMRDKNGEYNVPVYNEYGKTKLLTAGVIVKLLRGITVEQATIERGIEVNRNYNREPDKIASELLSLSYFGPVSVCIKNTANDPNRHTYMIVATDTNGKEHKYRIPRDTTTLSAVLFGDWVNSVDEVGQEVPIALDLCGLHQFLNEDVAIRGGF